MFSKILMPVDPYHVDSNITAHFQLTNWFKTSYICLLYVLTPGLGNKMRAWSRLDKVVKDAGTPEQGFSTEVREGSPAVEICRAANEKKSDLILISGRRKSTIRTMLIGSTAKDVVRLADKPVFVHFHNPDQDKRRLFDTIIYATDFGEAAQRAIPYLKELGKVTSKCVILHARNRAADPFSEKRCRQGADELLEQTKQQIMPFFASVEDEVVFGRPSQRIIERAGKDRANLIVLGRNNSSSQKIMGSTAEGVTGKVHCSILMVP